ncbi:hypothetical protein K470DRAFT_296363 [Piedraia hortae CBS 480.64]|uniref:CMP/dCMP-type deaminase domain-containing protein n=1 Tax=Piedraia hortae CBS 480.64 TaxID=1314780 RepID=A0A6A7BTK5_9PEZI|nr:hypothetical protein K470DRAFT_296363 [Piedraia hortae CBS 480.64]
MATLIMCFSSVLSSLFALFTLHIHPPLERLWQTVSSMGRSAFHALRFGPTPVLKKSATTPKPPRRRYLLHLKTKEECRLGLELIKMWIVQLPSKHAEGILRVIKANIEGIDGFDLQHLRRFVKPKYLPEHVVASTEAKTIKELYFVPREWEDAPPALMQSPEATWDWSTPPAPRSGNNRSHPLYLLICPSALISKADLLTLMSQHPPFCSSADSWAFPLDVLEIEVPAMAPTSAEQAELWSVQYWPTFYRKTNPFGAHPAAILKAEDELHKCTGNNVGIDEALALAEDVGEATKKLKYGTGAGCVILERTDDKTEIVSIAGDGRYKPLTSPIGVEDADEAEDKPKSKNKKKKERQKKNKAVKKIDESTGCSGNIMAHAVMRALGMVGRKRLRCASQSLQCAAAKAESNFTAAGLVHDEKARDAFFLDLPVTALEKKYFDKDNLKPDGYLCLKLEVFLTHEPCMMCSMALVHSRVGRVVFKHRMPKTGGLTAELARNDSGPVGLGYGMCWRKELNWQFMCWEYTPRLTHKDKLALKDRYDDLANNDDDDDDDDDNEADDGMSDFTRVHV